MGTLLEDRCDFMTLSRCIFRDLGKFYNKHSKENKKHTSCHTDSSEECVAYEVIPKNAKEQEK
jgi:hypothetical protein